MHNTKIQNSEKIPLAYKIGKTVFYNNELLIDKRVYVPNEETELMVNYSIEFIRKNKLEKAVIFDVGTGSGNIAIGIAKEFPKAKIIAIDISKEALDVAELNIEKHNIKNITLLNSNLVEKINIKPDLIISDLPWGDDEHLLKTNDKDELLCMPSIAVFAEEGIVGAYIQLCEMIRKKQWNTTLIIETGVLKEHEIADEIPKTFHWQYIKIPNPKFNYSITKIKF